MSSSPNPSSSSSDDTKVKVAIRVRPFNRRESDLETQCIVEVNGQQIVLQNPSTSGSSSIPMIKPQTHDHHQPHASCNNNNNNNSSNSNGSSSNRNNNTNHRSINHSSMNYKQFAFDHCFWSFDETDGHFASQEQVYRELGLPVLESAFQGYNACIFAYGQTGSGKSYTMMGTARDKGLIPRLCDGIFERIHSHDADEKVTFKVEVSYMEIYNERVHDLLDPKGVKANLRVREHNILGPYVDGLSKLAVSSFEQIDNLMTEGNKSRTVAATNMNSESSRSHAVFTITLTCSITDSDAGVTGEKVSKMSLVDLAGSERAVKTGAVGDRLKEGSNINKSLTTLGLVISKLADSASGRSGGKEQFVPYRDSVLTWLLKDNLGGNSKTVMVATISPAADNYEESLSTLRYADRAKRIVNHAIVNEDPNARMIRELKAEVEVLREQLKNATTSDVLKERLQESENLIKEMTQTWEERLRKTELIHQERQKQLEKMGISVQSSGIKVETDKYYLVNLNSDPAMNELLVYYLKDRTLVGRCSSSENHDRDDGKAEQDIQLSGIGIQDEHAIIEIHDNQLYMIPLAGARTCVNGSVIRDKTALSHGDRILWGNNHFFKVSCPKKAKYLGQDHQHHHYDNHEQQKVEHKEERGGYTSFEDISDPDHHEQQYHNNSSSSNRSSNNHLKDSYFSETMSSSASRAGKTRTSADLTTAAASASASASGDDENEYSSIDFDFAREECMMKQLSNDPIQRTILKSLERQHEDDKTRALEKQREMYEKQLQLLRNQISPTAPYATPLVVLPMSSTMSDTAASTSGFTGSNSMLQQSVESLGSSCGRLNQLGGNGNNRSSSAAADAYAVQQAKIERWAKERDELFKKSLAQLKEDIVRANSLVFEANTFAQELGRITEFKVTLQIPAANLSPNRKKGAFVSEPAILVKRKNKASQVWSMEKMENKLIDMRDLYESCKSSSPSHPSTSSSSPRSSSSFDEETTTTASSNNSSITSSSNHSSAKHDPFFESSETHHLIGVASIFLDVLFHDVVLDYQIPIISQQGEVAGRLQVEISRIAGQMGERMADAGADQDVQSSAFDDQQQQQQQQQQQNNNQILDEQHLLHVPTISVQQETGRDGKSSSSPTVGEMSRNSSPEDYFTNRNQVVVRVKLKAARGLPIQLSNYVFCQYSFWGSADAVVAPAKSNRDMTQGHTMPEEENGVSIVNFDHIKEFTVNLSEEFLDHCTDGALAIEVWGHRSVGFTSPRHSGWEVLAETQIAEVNKSLSDRWSELKRKIELWVEILELNDNGEYAAVEVTQRENNLTGGVYQLRQGQQRRILVKVNPFPGDTGTLPLICEAITSVAIGAVQVRHRMSSELDSYQEDDLKNLKEKWKDALDRRRIYLRDQMLKLDSKVDKTEEDEERGKRLLDQWVNLLEEEKACDDPHSEIPGSFDSSITSNLNPDGHSYGQSIRGMEQHIPLVFLDLSPDDISAYAHHNQMIAGLNLILPKESNSSFFNLPILKYNDKDVSVIAAWDSSIHDTPALNRSSTSDERISLIVRVTVRLSHPAVLDLILRKRISINVYKRQSLTDRIKKKILPDRFDGLTSTGVVYEIVSSIPKESEEVEERESLALVAATTSGSVESCTNDGESYIEKYTKGVSAVEAILALDRLRQEVAIRELIAASGTPNAATSAIISSGFSSSNTIDYVRKTLSVPNFGLMAHVSNAGSMPRLDRTANTTTTAAAGASSSVGEFGSNFDISALIAKAGNLFVGSSSSGTSSPSYNHPSTAATDRPLSSTSSSTSQTLTDARQIGSVSGAPLSTLSPAKSVKPMKTVIENREDIEDNGNHRPNGSA